MPRALVLGLAALVTALFLATVFWLGAAYFDASRFSVHERRLQRMLAQQPSLEQVSVGLRDDGSPLVESPESPRALRELAARWPAREAEILAKAARSRLTRVFHAADVYYIIYFRPDGRMQDFSCVDARPLTR